MTGGRTVAKVLKKFGVEHLFTLCGGHIMDIYEGCNEVGIRVIDFRHEQSAAFAADAYGRLKKIPGVAAVTAGPGVMNAVTAVANSFKAQTPMILIGGQAPSFFVGKGALQEMNHTDVLKPITKWSATVPTVNDISEFLHRAFEISISGVPGPVFLEMPADILFSSSEQPSFREMNIEKPKYHKEKISEISELLMKSERPVLLLGSQALFSPYHTHAKEICEKIGVPVFLSGMARGALGRDHPLILRFSRKRSLKEADLVILAGTPLDFRLDYGRSFGDLTKIIRLDLSAEELGRNRKGDISEECDPLEILFEVSKKVEGTPKRCEEWIEMLKNEDEKKERESLKEAELEVSPVNPVKFSKIIDELLPENSIIIGDGGDIVGTAAYFVKPSFSGGWLDPGPLGTLGVGAPFAIAAKLARPDCDVFVIFGDGSFGFNCMEYDSAVRHKIGFVGIIGNDAGWTQIKRAQVPMYGKATATELDWTRYDKLVEALGGYGEYVEKPQDMKSALLRCLEKSRQSIPTVLNVKIGETQFRKGSISM